MKQRQQTRVGGPRDLLDLVGRELGTSDVRSVTQDEINMFAAVTKDHQWIHVDVERAKTGPFGGTIAHGFLTLSLVPALFGEILTLDSYSMGINYGLNRVRFIKPLPPGVEVQASATLASARLIPGEDGSPDCVEGIASVLIEFAEDAAACCAAETVFRYYV